MAPSSVGSFILSGCGLFGQTQSNPQQADNAATGSRAETPAAATGETAPAPKKVTMGVRASPVFRDWLSCCGLLGRKRSNPQQADDAPEATRPGTPPVNPGGTAPVSKNVAQASLLFRDIGPSTTPGDAGASASRTETAAVEGAQGAPSRSRASTFKTPSRTSTFKTPSRAATINTIKSAVKTISRASTALSRVANLFQHIHFPTFDLNDEPDAEEMDNLAAVPAPPSQAADPQPEVSHPAQTKAKTDATEAVAAARDVGTSAKRGDVDASSSQVVEPGKGKAVEHTAPEHVEVKTPVAGVDPDEVVLAHARAVRLEIEKCMATGDFSYFGKVIENADGTGVALLWHTERVHDFRALYLLNSYENPKGRAGLLGSVETYAKGNMLTSLDARAMLVVTDTNDLISVSKAPPGSPRNAPIHRIPALISVAIEIFGANHLASWYAKTAKGYARFGFKVVAVVYKNPSELMPHLAEELDAIYAEDYKQDEEGDEIGVPLVLMALDVEARQHAKESGTPLPPLPDAGDFKKLGIHKIDATNRKLDEILDEGYPFARQRALEMAGEPRESEYRFRDENRPRPSAIAE